MKTICTDTDGTDKPIKDSIYSNLADRYNIFYRVINFKDYGVPSSRPRTIVIGTSKEYAHLSHSLSSIKTQGNQVERGYRRLSIIGRWAERCN